MSEVRIANYDVNLSGRDFICGDVHGSYSFIAQFLEHINFDKSKDRLFAVGDIIDRGPENEKCLLLLDEPWLHSVLGNHEAMMLEYANSEYYGNYWEQNGGRWGIKYFPESIYFPKSAEYYQRNDQYHGDVRRITRQKVSKLPHIINLKLSTGETVHIIHAEFHPKAKLSEEILNDPEKIKREAFMETGDGHAILWGRYAFTRMNGNDLSSDAIIAKIKHGFEINRHLRPKSTDIGRIFSGHTPVLKPVQFSGRINLDTMAYYSYNQSSIHRGLTFVNPVTNEYWLSNIHGVRTNNFIEI